MDPTRLHSLKRSGVQLLFVQLNWSIAGFLDGLAPLHRQELYREVGNVALGQEAAES